MPDPNNQQTVKLDRRARLGPAAGAMKEVLGNPFDCENILRPLIETRGMLFPYTPDITFGGIANYGNWHFTHSNYQQYQYQNSAPQEFQITGVFTAQTNIEAQYLLAVLMFLRASTMLEFGSAAVRKDVAGTPPPVLRFNYLGDQMFNNVPVVLLNYSYLLEREVDYVEIIQDGVDSNARSNPIAGLTSGVQSLLGLGGLPGRAGGSTFVPTQMVITLMLGVQQNPRAIRENFDLDKFKSGDLINKGFI